MHVTWLYTSGNHTNTDTSAVDTTTVTTTTEEEDNGPESGSVDAISYVGEASHHDIEFVDDHTVHLLRTWSATSETAHGADSAALSSDRTQNDHNQDTSSYGRIEYSDGLIYEGECCTMQPHGWVSSSLALLPCGWSFCAIPFTLTLTGASFSPYIGCII